MRIEIGKIVNLDREVNLIDLKPLDRVIAAAMNAYQGTSMYKRRVAETEEFKEEQFRKVREALTDSLLQTIYPYLDENKGLKEKGDICKGILISIPSTFKKFINDVIDSHEFDAYNLTILPPSRLLSKFSDPPFLLYAENKGG